MRALIQRVTRASVSVEGEVLGSIGRGLVVLIGVGRNDSEEDARYLAEKIPHLRIFADDAGRFNLSALDVGGDILAISQFTLFADTCKGRRPSFTEAAPPEKAEVLFERAVELLRASGLRVAAGRFQAYMQVEIHNDGPVTLMLDSKDKLA